MRFMSIVTSAHTDMPTPELMEAMGKLADREIKAGRMIDMGGLMLLETGAQVRIRDGELSVIDGPFVEAALRKPAPRSRRRRNSRATGASRRFSGAARRKRRTRSDWRQ